MLLAAVAMPACRTPAPEQAKVVRLEHVKENLYVLHGGGGNTAALVTSAGILLVDTKLPGWGPAMSEALRTVTDKPVTAIINTHSHGDHTAGNTYFTTATQIVAHERTRRNMANYPEYQGEGARALPNRTFTDRLSLTFGSDQVELYNFGPAHTGGDAIVVFPALRVAHMGDFFSQKTPPVIERFGGGSGIAFPDALARAGKEISGVDQIITGHGDVLLPWSALADYEAFNREFLTWARAQHDAGVSENTAGESWVLPDRYKDYVDTWRVTTNVRTLYDEFDGKPPRSLRPPWWRRLW